SISISGKDETVIAGLHTTQELMRVTTRPFFAPLTGLCDRFLSFQKARLVVMKRTEQPAA
ncbi:MAG TPA: hypothetical protein PKN31_05550, partial [Candidatus Atribacteria bacterium]|nr:hypothetical protein [Candidatus Atribacteria bacterium]